jgi:nucleoside-diphosphate-sugar epimerase
MTRVLVTGANGFIGRCALRALAGRGDYEVHGVTSRSPGPAGGAARWHTADLMDPRQVHDLLGELRPTHLLHLAWYTAPPQYWTSTENFRWVQASLELLRQFAERGGQRVVMAGTCAEYDWRYGYCSEAVTPLQPATTYGACKNALRSLLEEYSRRTGLSSAWGRVFLLYGPHESPGRLVPSVIGALSRGEPAPCTSGSQVRDFLHVQDVADALVTLMASGVKGAVNIASGKPVAVREVVWAIADRLGRRDLVRLGALPDRPEEPPVLLADVGRLTHECVWSPRYDLDAGLEETIGWWNAQAARVRP